MMIATQVTENRILQYMQTYAWDEAQYYDYVTVTTKVIKMTLAKIPTIFVSIDLSRNKFEGEIPNVSFIHALKGLNISHDFPHVPKSSPFVHINCIHHPHHHDIHP